jgi:hypothetical protein
MSNTSKPACCSRVSNVSGSTGTNVSPIWMTRIHQFCRLSLPKKKPPGLRTRNTSCRTLSCSCGEGTWCSMVNETVPENSESRKGIPVASPSTTRTLLPSRRALSDPASFESISSAVSRGTDVRSRSVVSPGPGPISKTFGPRLVSPITHGRRSPIVVRQQSERHSHRCKRFMSPLPAEVVSSLMLVSKTRLL